MQGFVGEASHMERWGCWVTETVMTWMDPTIFLSKL